jgi:hypothetical protein
MPINSDYNFTDILSLDKAKLVNRMRLNFLGSQEMVLQYNGISSAMREDAVEYLEQTAGFGVASAMVSPTFGFKTYEGNWLCIDITYTETGLVGRPANTIRQTFKIDAQIGDLGDPDVTPVSSQVGDDVRISDGMTLERSYYWRIVNPERVGLPTAITGQIWTKTSNDNGDGTYDVIISKEVEQDLTADSEVQAGPSSNGGYIEDTTVHTNSTALAFGAGVTPAVTGQIIRIDNVPLENGKFRTTVTTRTAIPAKKSVTYPSDWGNLDDTVIVARNQTEATFDTDVGNISGVLVNTVSFSINDYGLYDYRITKRF